ncbi:MAG: polysaccharide biosynthesis tyrosine autokinase [Pseudomonadota bacterium]
MNKTTPYSAYDYDNAGIIDFQGILNAIRRHIVPIGIAVILVLGLTALSYMLTKPIYSSTARIGIERQTPDVVQATQDRNQPLTTDSSSVDTEVAQVRSTETLGEVVDRLKLDQRADFAGDATSKDEARRRAMAALSSNLSVSRDGDSYTIEIGYSSRDPQLATTIANTTMDIYFDRQRGEKEGRGQRDVALLSSRLESLKVDVARADTAVAQFRAATNLVDIQNDNTSAQQNLSVLSSQLAAAQAEQAAAEARNSATSARSAGAGSSVVSPVLQQLRTEESRLSAQRESLASRYGPSHPALRDIDQQLTEARRQISAETARVREGLAADAAVARRKSSSIVSSIGAQEGQLLQGNAASVRLGQLEREATSAKSLYEALLERYRQAVARQGTERGNAYVISRAVLPLRPDSPKLPIYAAGGLICAFLAASLVTAGLELLESGFSTRRQVERALALPVLASIPDLTKLPKNAIKSPSPMTSSAHLIDRPGDIFSESFRAIRTGLRIGRENQTIRSLAICSALPNEGKTTTAFSLARSAALSGKKVLLVDCDLRRQASSRQVEGKIEYGLLELLRGQATMEQAITKDSASGAFLLPQRATGEQDYDMIASSEMKILIDRLKTQFDLVILDTAPILAIADSRAIASMADATLMAVRWRKTPTQAVQMALDQLKLAEANVAGIVLTLVDVKAQMRAGAGDEMRYYKSYAQYYN